MKQGIIVSSLIAAIAGFVLLICNLESSGHNEKCVAMTKEKEMHLKNDTADANINLKVFIENSGSMDGYVNGMTTFKTDLYSLISSSAIKTLKLYYINDTTLMQPNNARAFVLNLSPSDFKEKGGNRGYTDIANVIQTVLASTKENEVALLASDYIFSLGHSSDDVNSFLEMQKIDITNMFEKKYTASKNFGVVFLRNFSRFNGTYFDPQDNPYVINQNRPFYVMLAGNRTAISKLLNATRGVTNFTDEYAEFAPITVAHEVMSKLKKGTCQIKKHGICGEFPTHLTKCKAEKRSSDFVFQMAINYSKIPLSFKYLEDPANYSISDKNYKILSVEKADATIGKHPYTHVMTIKKIKGDIRNTNIVIKVNKTQPQWITSSNTKATQGYPDEKSTFGLFPLLSGIKGAFENQTKSDFYTKFDIIIEK